MTSKKHKHLSNGRFSMQSPGQDLSDKLKNLEKAIWLSSDGGRPASKQTPVANTWLRCYMERLHSLTPAYPHVHMKGAGVCYSANSTQYSYHNSFDVTQKFYVTDSNKPSNSRGTWLRDMALICPLASWHSNTAGAWFSLNLVWVFLSLTWSRKGLAELDITGHSMGHPNLYCTYSSLWVYLLMVHGLAWVDLIWTLVAINLPNPIRL